MDFKGRAEFFLHDPLDNFELFLEKKTLVTVKELILFHCGANEIQYDVEMALK